MNILFLSPRLPLPADTGGKIRTLNILKQLSKENRVHLICFSFEKNDHDYLEGLKKWGVTVSLVAIEEPSIFDKLKGVCFNPIPFSISKYDTYAMRQRIQEILKKQVFDAVHIDHLHMAGYKECFKDLPVMLDEHNVEFRILERCSGVETNFIKKILYHQQAKKMKIFEAEYAQKFTSIFACSLDDQKILNTITHNSVVIHVIANGVDTEYFNVTSNQAFEKEEAIVFTGSMDWLPNDDAITYFCANILPLIWKENEAVKFYVVGKNPSPAVKELASRDARVIVTGRVDDVRPYMERSRIFIVPLRIGGGTRLKILEAMSMGKTVVSSTIGAEGIECEDKKNIFLADKPQDFADQVLFLLKDGQRSQAVGIEARQLVCERYDWNIIGQRLKKIYEEAVRVPKK